MAAFSVSTFFVFCFIFASTSLLSTQTLLSLSFVTFMLPVTKMYANVTVIGGMNCLVMIRPASVALLLRLILPECKPQNLS